MVPKIDKCITLSDKYCNTWTEQQPVAGQFPCAKFFITSPKNKSNEVKSTTSKYKVDVKNYKTLNHDHEE